MDHYREEARELPITSRADVVVVGGGVAGVSAAIASARTGIDTLLVERYGALGGNLTIGLRAEGCDRVPVAPSLL